MKKYFIVICFMFLASIALGQSKYKIGPIEIEDNDTTAEFTNRNLKTNSITATTMDVTGDMKTQALYSDPITLTGTDIDWTESNMFFKTVAVPTDFTFSNVRVGQVINVIFLSTGVGAVTFTDEDILWVDGVQPTGTANYDVWSFIAVTPSRILGTAVQNFIIP